MKAQLPLSFIVSILISFVSQSQVFMIKDIETNKPIYLVSITNQKGYGTYSKEDGSFLLSFSKADSIIISHLSYNPVKLTYSELIQLENKTIQLTPKIILLREALVRPSKVEKISLGYYKNKTFFKRVGPGGKTDFNVYVNHIKNTNGIVGYLDKLFFDLFVDITEKSNSKVRIRIFSVGTDGLPQNDILTTEIIRRVDRITPNIHVDVSKHNIIFPPEGLFIGLEFFCNFEMKQMKNSKSQKTITNCPHIPTAKIDDSDKFGNSYYWSILKGKFQWICYSDGKTYAGSKGHVYKFGAEVVQ